MNLLNKITENFVEGIHNVQANLIYMKKRVLKEELPSYAICPVGSRCPEYWKTYRKEKRQSIIKQIKNTL